MVNYQLLRSYYEDPDAMRQIDRGIAKLDDRIVAAVGTQIYDHVEGSLRELLRLRTILNESRHYQNFNHDIIEHYVNKFLRLEDELTKQKRLSKKEEERVRWKSKVLTSLHKNPLPIIRDSLDVLHWKKQVNELVRALADEGDSPVMKQKVCSAIKTSMQGPRFSQLGRTLEVSQDLTQVLDLIQGYCRNVYNVLVI